MEVSIRYKHDNRIEIDGYFVTRQYAITLKEPKKFKALVTSALKNGANQMYGVEYRSSELRKHRDQARSMAIKAAKEKAVDLARELECEVGKPRTIGESSWGYWGPASRWGGNSWMTQNSVQQQAGGGEGGETMPLGQIGIKATVSVTLDLITK